MDPVKLFISYAHKDEPLKEELMAGLSPLRRLGQVEIWEDRQILGGAKWDEAIKKAMLEAHIILLLISNDFINSDFCYSEEMTIALERSTQGRAVVIPIFLRPCDFSELPFAAFQGLPRNALPVTKWENTDEAWTDVSSQLRAVIKQIKAAG